MPQLTGFTCFVCLILLVLTACDDLSYQVGQPHGYGEILPGNTWVAVDGAYQSPSREMVYYDPKTLHRNDDRVTLWQLRDYKMMQGNAPFGMFMMSPHRFLSTKTQKEFNCTHHTVRLLASSEFSHHMGTGTSNAALISPGHEQPVEPGSINQALWEVACGTTSPR
ncbi:MAG: hypothetical protein JNL29_16285 [Nitrospira sp.]|nr:hypothetical protein [Nitrospira sp.]